MEVSLTKLFEINKEASNVERERCLKYIRDFQDGNITLKELIELVEGGN